MDDKISNNYGINVPVKHPNFPRVGHKVVQLDGEAYIFGGSSLDGALVKTNFKINLEKLKVQPLLIQNPLGIQGFSIFTYQGLIYLWGGNVHGNNNPPQMIASNTLWCFDGKKYIQCQQHGEIPSPRAFHCSSFFANRFLIIYGGFAKQLFTDWCILDMQNKTWKKMAATSKLPLNTIFQLGWVNGRGILISTEAVSHKDSAINTTFKNQLYELKFIDFKDFKFKIEPLAYFQSQKPEPRSQPGIIFSSKEIFMLGGLKHPKCYSIKNGVQYGQFFNDIWTFDLETLQWSRNSCKIFLQYGFSALKYQNKIYSFAGLKSPYVQLSSTFEIVSLDQYPDLIEDRLCKLCKYVYGFDKRSVPNKPSALSFHGDLEQPVAQITSNFISKISELLQNPLNALALLIDNSLNMSASTISIKFSTKNFTFQNHSKSPTSPHPEYFKNPISSLSIMDNSQIFHIDEIIRLFHMLKWKIFPTTSDPIYEEELNLQNQYVNNLRLGGLRLAKSCLFVTKNHNSDILVIYFTSNPFDIPENQKPMDCCFYKLEGPKNLDNSIPKKQKVCSSRTDRQIINKNLSHLISQNQYLDFSKYSTKLYLFDVQQLTRTQLSSAFSYHGQNSTAQTQQGSSLNKYDIALTYTPLCGDTNSLFDMIRKMYLVPYLGRHIQVENSGVVFVDLYEQFKRDQQKDRLQKIQIPESELNMFSRCCLYRITSIGYNFASVYIYHENRLITSITTKQKSICGYIQIPKEIEVDIFKSKLARLQDHRKLVHYIQSKDFDRKRPKLRRSPSQFQNAREKDGRKLQQFELYSLN